MQMIYLILRDSYSAISVCVVNVASYDNYMLINSYLTFCFLLFSFFYDNLIAIRCISTVYKGNQSDKEYYVV